MTPLRVLALAAALAAGPAAAQTEAEAIASNFGLAVDLCLQHVRDRNPVESFRAAGFVVRAADEGTFDIDTLGVSGFLAPLVPSEWCWIGSDRLSRAQVEAIAHERALYRYPQGVSGPATPGFALEFPPVTNCAGLTVAQAGRITTLIVTNSPIWEGCAAPDTGGILFQ
jgi:hypothetical protein